MKAIALLMIMASTSFGAIVEPIRINEIKKNGDVIEYVEYVITDDDPRVGPVFVRVFSSEADLSRPITAQKKAGLVSVLRSKYETEKASRIAAETRKAGDRGDSRSPALAVSETDLR